MRVRGALQIVTLVLSFGIVFGLGRLIGAEPAVVPTPPRSAVTTPPTVRPTTEPGYSRDFPKDLPPMPRPRATPAESDGPEPLPEDGP